MSVGTIAVTAVGGGIGQAIQRALCLSSLSWHTIGLDVDCWAAGLYTSQRGYLVPYAKDASYLERLLQVLKDEKVQVVIPGSDAELPIIAASKIKLLDANVLPIVSEAECVRICREKLATCHFFREHGFPFALTVPANEGLQLAKEVGFPLIVKPLGGSASRGIDVVFSEEELGKYINRADMIIQEYLVPKKWNLNKRDLTKPMIISNGLLRQEDEISIQVLFDHEGQFLGQFTSLNVLKSGIPISIDPWSRVEVDEVAYKMASLLVQRGLIGPCNLQCKLTERGPIFFEINPRFTGITAVRAAMGFNEVEAVLRRVLLNEPVEQVRRRLKIKRGLVCSRYITEIIIQRTDLEEIQGNGYVEGNGRRVTL